jgi:hypothetical protein
MRGGFVRLFGHASFDDENWGKKNAARSGIGDKRRVLHAATICD